ncbi:hypothetical protein RAG66_22085, partial [Klebsiella quasipneumoniae subsp. similipneumoniae]
MAAQEEREHWRVFKEEEATCQTHPLCKKIPRPADAGEGLAYPELRKGKQTRESEKSAVLLFPPTPVIVLVDPAIRRGIAEAAHN